MNERRSSVDEMAEHFGVVQEAVFRWIENHGLPSQKIGRLRKLAEGPAYARLRHEWVKAGGADEPVRQKGYGMSKEGA